VGTRSKGEDLLGQTERSFRTLAAEAGGMEVMGVVGRGLQMSEADDIFCLGCKT
jgi:hypothetical protein